MDKVLVWTARTEAREVQDRLPSYQRLLTDDEKQRAQRFAQRDDATRFIVGRALARTMLSRFADVSPEAWEFVIGEHGRPELARRPPGAPDLRFNLTHTTGMVACALTIGREVGVDIEHINRRLSYEVPERFFSPQEVADLRALPEADQPTVFFDYWTLKEAYIKARGLGLALPLRQFTFMRSDGHAPSIAFAPELHDDADSWQFAQFWPSADHRMAVAVRRTGADLPIDVEETVPEVPA
ncbi:MAG TPA: 4'-phosphopantetheinyl transferase superfamily protein [Vicinamibacterales bacterium]|nr:4'-phosphopantetheinyl transferase superfamily protein [Vicinamibacterales bacterium]